MSSKTGWKIETGPHNGVARISVKMGHCENGLSMLYFDANEARKYVRSEPEQAGGLRAL